MRRFSAFQLLLAVASAALVWTVIAIGCGLVGSTGLGVWPSYEIFTQRCVNYVLPASLVGAALAAAGVAYQAILRNPLSDPYLLGVSSGASLAAYCWRLPALGAVAASLINPAFSQQLFAFAGALAAVTIVLLLAGGRGRIEPVTAILVGVIVNSICGALFLLLVSVYRDLPGSGGTLTFLIGDLQTNISRGQRVAAVIIIGVGWLTLLFLSGPLGVARLGDDEARALGVRVQRVRWAGLIVASLMTAAAVAVSGPIGFVGLICPHLARVFVGADPRRVLPLATALGAALLCVADAATRHLSGTSLGTQLPVGVITGLLGGPFFLVLMLRARRAREAA